jgi:hypothetical protein
MKKIIFILMLISSLLCCKPKSNDVATDRISITPERMWELQDSIIKWGDTHAYSFLMRCYGYDFDSKNLLYYSLIMANKYGYSTAYYDVYQTLVVINALNFNGQIGLDSLPIELCELAINHLKKAVEMGEPYAKEELGNIYIEGKYVQQDIELGKKLVKEYEQYIDSIRTARQKK